MEKILTLLRRPASQDAAAFCAGCLAEGRRLTRDADTALRRCIVNVADDAAKEGVLDPKRPPPAYDAAVETWWTSADTGEPLLAVLARLGGDCYSYRVREVVQKQYARTWAVGERSPGIKGVYTVNRRADLSHEGFAKHWRDGHGPLALKHHVGLIKYVQNVSLGAITPGAPAFDGFATLHFPTARDMRERFYDSPEGARIIAADVKKFIGSPSMQINCSEYLLRDQEPA
jgi:uncharacterized protein (TIGR02118 family)